MNKKIVVIGAVVIAIILVSVIIKLIPTEEAPYYSDDPATWVDKKPGGIKEVSVDKVTEGDGYIDPIGQQYETTEIATAFSYEGWYKGEYFRREHVANGKVIIRINQEMNPNDGVIEGYIVEKIKDSKPIAYVFLDKDWKDKVQNTKIYWGKKYQNEKEFNFSQEISDGIFMNEIEDDIDRFENNYALHNGGIWVGDLKDKGSTVISFS